MKSFYNRIYYCWCIVVDSIYIYRSAFQIVIYTTIKNTTVFFVKYIFVIYIQRIILPVIYTINCN